MIKRFFIFLYPSDRKVQSLLDLAVFCLNPAEKWPAHVTVGGPFARRPSLLRSLPLGTTAFSLGVGNFFNQGINTVYLKAGIVDLWKIWNKPDFKGNPVPHLSLYNGKDEDEAREIFVRISGLRPFFAFSVLDPAIVSSVSGQESMDLREKVDTAVLARTRDLRIDDLRALDFQDRLSIAEEAIRTCIPQASNPKPGKYDALTRGIYEPLYEERERKGSI